MKKGMGLVKLAVVFISAMMITSCGSSDKGMYTATTEEAAEFSKDSFAGIADYKSSVDMDENASEYPKEAETPVDTSRKLITTMNISSETENLDETLDILEKKINELGGYIESSNVSNGSYYSGRTFNRNAALTARIPADRLDDFITAVEGNTNITSKSKDVEDVTLSYVDTESRKKALKTEESRLLQILEKAETVEDIIAVESRLSEVRYQIESNESQLRTYDNKINYSTVYIDISEVTKYTPVKEKNAFARMAEGFKDSFFSVINTAVECFIWIVIHIPQLIVSALIITIVVIASRKFFAAKKVKKEVSKENQEERKDGQ